MRRRHQIDEKVPKLVDLLPKFRREDLDAEKDMLKELFKKGTRHQGLNQGKFVGDLCSLARQSNIDSAAHCKT